MSALSRKLFVRMAKEYLDARPPVEDQVRYATWVHVVYVTANVFNESAATFDKQRFLTAAGVLPVPVGASS